MQLRQRQPRIRDRDYLGYIAELPCLVCGTEPVECAHVRYGDPGHDKRETGAGEKPSDYWAVPLCPQCHRLGNDAQHRRGEREWWQAKGIDPIKVCLHLQAIHELDKAERHRWARAYVLSVGKVGNLEPAE